MAVTDVKPLASERTSNGDSSARTYQSLYEVHTDDKYDGPITAANAVIALVPVGSAYQWPPVFYATPRDVDAGAFCYPHPAARLREGARGNRKMWSVTLIHSTRSFPTCRDGAPATPLDEPARWSGSFIERLVVARKDKNGDLIGNSADEPFVPAVEVNEPIDTVSVQFNTLTIDLEARASFRGRLNRSPFWGMPKRCIKLRRWDWTPQTYGACLEYVSHSMEFEINTDGFDEDRLDEGFRTKANDGGVIKYVELRDAKNRKLTSPKPLDGNGQLLSDADIIAGNFHYVTVEATPDIEFSGLPLPPLPGCVV